MGILEFLGLRTRANESAGRARRWLVVSNRLPFRWNRENATLEKSAGGLVAAINSVHSSTPMLWLGTAPEDLDPERWRAVQVPRDSQLFEPIFVEKDRYNRFYNGMCNSVLWPLLHYEGGLLRYSEQDWNAYIEVNRAFAEALLKLLKPDDLIWVHDFHLMLLPMFLRRLEVKQPIGFFLHTPFPSAEVFRQLPARAEVLRGLLAADLVGFHDYSYLRYFSDSVWNVLGYESSNLSIDTENRTCQLGVFPVSVDTPHLRELAESSEVAAALANLNTNRAVTLRVLGVDRLDYIKGLKLKFKIFRNFLASNQELAGKVVLTQIVVPSRTDVPGFAELKSELDQMVGEINGTFAKPGYVPLEYIYGSISQADLLAFYRSSNVLMVTSRRDGMNLVALEYLAAQPQDNPGVVMLSEFTGATSALSEAISINPWDCEGTARLLKRALDMNLEERIKRHRMMLSHLDQYTATSWANMFVESLLETQRGMADDGATQLLLPQRAEQPALKELGSLLAKKKRIFFCDYDGTLVGYHANPEEAVPNQQTRAVLEGIAFDPQSKFVLVSGRSNQFLARVFSGLNLEYSAEHGAEFHPAQGDPIVQTVQLGEDLLDAIRRVLQHYSIRVPGSFIEEKRYGLVWHYRRSTPEFAALQARKLKAELESYLANQPVKVTSGKKIIEVRALGSDKGSFVEWYLKHFGIDDSYQILAIGDDATDEDMFAAVRKLGGRSIRVGPGQSNADYRLKSHKHVLDFLKWVEARSG